MAATKQKAASGRKAGPEAKAGSKTKARPESPEGRAGRRRFFKLWIGLTFLMGIAAAVLGPALTADSNIQRWVAVFAAGMIVLLLLGVGWLAIYVHRRRRP